MSIESFRTFKVSLNGTIQRELSGLEVVWIAKKLLQYLCGIWKYIEYGFEKYLINKTVSILIKKKWHKLINMLLVVDLRATLGWTLMLKYIIVDRSQSSFGILKFFCAKKKELMRVRCTYKTLFYDRFKILWVIFQCCSIGYLHDVPNINGIV